MAKQTGAQKQSPRQKARDESWLFRLYVADKAPRCVTAFVNLKKICEEHLAGQYRIEVIDLLEKPQLAKQDQIVAIPTLVRLLPPPMRKVIGNLADTERVVINLGLRPEALTWESVATAGVGAAGC